MNDAIYSRRVKVEDALDISMRTDRYAELEYMSQIKKLFVAGDHAFDLMFNHCRRRAAVLYAHETGNRTAVHRLQFLLQKSVKMAEKSIESFYEKLDEAEG